MIPVDQTDFGFERGNCFSACVASILEMPLDDVPFFMTGDDWWHKFTVWCTQHGVEPIYVLGYPPPVYLNRPELFRHYILSGHSPRLPGDPTKLHSTVAFDTEIVHDPHPDRTGLLSRDDCIFLRRILRRPRKAA